MFGTNYAFSKLREKVNKTDWVSLKALLTRSAKKATNHILKLSVGEF